jgi:Right handed beta helix region
MRAASDQYEPEVVEGACPAGVRPRACPRRQRQQHERVEQVNLPAVLMTTSAWGSNRLTGRSRAAVVFAVLWLVHPAGSASAQTRASCNLAGGSSGSPTDLDHALSNKACRAFILGDGYYTSASIGRAGITLRAAHRCQAHVEPELEVQADDVVVDGVSITSSETALSVHNPGVQILNTCIQGFGKTEYANGIWVFLDALDPNKHVIIKGNTLDDWGGVQYAGGIAVGKAADDRTAPTEISVEILDNRVTNGPTADGLFSAAIQIFHPALIAGNYVDQVNNAAYENKTYNSRIVCNEASHVYGGALYNREDSNNLWENNLIHDSELGVEHFKGQNVVYRGNVIYNVKHPGLIKDFEDGASTDITIENNTFYHSDGAAGWIWDTTGGGPLGNILWRNNIWDAVNGAAIDPAGGAASAWDEEDNIFWQTTPPIGTTGAKGTSLTTDPRLVAPPSDFTPQAGPAKGKGAPWPLPCQGRFTTR